MITTGCSQCHFLRRNDKGRGCAVQQLCVVEDIETFAPGYCRMCRSSKWAEKQEITDLKILSQRVIEENALWFDMLIFFDETIHTIKDLELTLDADWYTKYAKKIIIMDVTGFGDRKNLALQYLKSRKNPVETVVNSSVVQELAHQWEDTIRRVSGQVSAPFFLALPAGKTIKNFDTFAHRVQHVSSRVIHWSFPLIVGGTTIVPYQLYYGLFITKPYLSLMKTQGVESFTDQLKKEEVGTQIRLSWLCEYCWLM